MSSENVGVVRNCYDAFRRRDIQAILGLLDPGVEYYQSDEIPWGGHYCGHTGVAEFSQNLTSAIESNVDPDNHIDNPRMLAALRP